MWREWRWLMVALNAVAALSPVIKIGAIFTAESRGGSAELAFKYAVYMINKDRNLLPESTLVYDIQYISATDTFRSYKKACEDPRAGSYLVQRLSIAIQRGNVASVMAPLHRISSPTAVELFDAALPGLACMQIKSGCVALFSSGGPLLGPLSAVSRNMHAPLFVATPQELSNDSDSFTANLSPSRQLMTSAFADLTSHLNWTRMGVIYEDYGYGDLSIVKLAKDGRDMYAVRCADDRDYRRALTQLKMQHVQHIFIDTDPQHFRHMARAILQLQMNNEDYHYIFTSFDMEHFDLEDFYYNRVNMSGWRVMDSSSENVRETLTVMGKFHPIGASILHGGRMKTEPALVFDAVQVLALALASTKHVVPANVSCEDEIPWSHGRELMDSINQVKTFGLSGPIEFENGIRTNFNLGLMRLRGGEDGGPVLSGYWTPEEGLEITDPAAYKRDPPPNVTLTVVTVEEKPYVMVKDGWNLQGNARFEGFCIDLLARVAARAGFQYRLRLVPDNMYGARDPVTGHWNGIVRELMDRKADLAVASMTINYAREAVIDFTKPFMNLGIGILFKVPTSQPTRLFSFLNPLAIEIWLYVLAAYILVSFTLFVMARFSPYEWSPSTHVCGHEAKLLTNQFSICNSFWFITGTFLRQGSGLNPKATSTRIVGGIWWFFTLIILSSYTANLAAFLTVERTVLPIQSAADLAAQNAIQYGTLNGGSTMTFFRDSNIEIYQKMWRHMSTASPPALVSSYEEGVRRVLQGNYAFLMESTMLDHRVQRDCNLTQIGGLLDSKGYGIATWKGSPWRDKISLAILELQEKGVIQILYDKWWKNTGDVCNREGKDSSKANPLGVQNIGGVFVTLLCGLVISIVVAILEFCWNTRKHASQGRQSLCSEMGQELRTAMRGGSSSRTALTGDCPRCSPATHAPPAALRRSPNRYEIQEPSSTMEMKELRWS